MFKENFAVLTQFLSKFKKIHKCSVSVSDSSTGSNIPYFSMTQTLNLLNLST